MIMASTASTTKIDLALASEEDKRNQGWTESSEFSDSRGKLVAANGGSNVGDGNNKGIAGERSRTISFGDNSEIGSTLACICSTRS